MINDILYEKILKLLKDSQFRIEDALNENANPWLNESRKGEMLLLVDEEFLCLFERLVDILNDDNGE